MKKQTPLLLMAGALSSMLVASSCGVEGQSQQARPNVLFICIDDLRTDLGCYGTQVKSPNLDNLASQGSLFNNHYVTVPTSGASRSSMLTGLLPNKRADLANEACVTNIMNRTDSSTPESMFHQMRLNGYYTIGIGKVSHALGGRVYDYPDPVVDKFEMPNSWDEVLFDYGKWETGWAACFAYGDGTNRYTHDKMVPPYECSDVEEDTDLPDGLNAQLACEKLEELAKHPDQPFCLAVGLLKPHLPFNSPKKYWDLYDESQIDISDFQDFPEGANPESGHVSGEFNIYKCGDEVVNFNNLASDDYARKLRHAYYACVSYSDALVGQILGKLDELGLSDNTIVVVWGDHGWQLGDLRMWGKHTIFEPSLRSTLIVKAPEQRANIVNDRVVSSVDIYPTLMDLCGIDVDYNLDGESFKSLLSHPNDEEWEDVAYSYFREGLSLRTPDYRLTRYYRKQTPTVELYSYEGRGFERRNIASEKPEVVEALMPMLVEKNTFYKE